MDRIQFTFEETNEDVIFAVLSSIQYKENAYLLVVDEQELEEDDLTAYVLKAVEMDEEDVIYELVDDDDELAEVTGLLEAELDDEFEMD